MTKARLAQLKLIELMLAAAMVVGTAAGARAATATWDPNTELDLAGYLLSYGTQSGVHTVVIDVGNVTTYQFAPPPGTIYVVVQAYNTAGDVSDKSDEVVVDIPGPPVVIPPPVVTPPPVTPPPVVAPPPAGQPPVSIPAPGAPVGPAPPGAPAPPVSQPPATLPPGAVLLIQPATQTTSVDTNVSLTLTVSNPEGGPLTFSAAGLPPGLSLNGSTGVISGIPRTPGLYQVTVTVSSGALSSRTTFFWSIVGPGGAGNQPPIMEQPDDRKTQLNSTVAFALFASDPEGRPLTFTATGLPPGLSLDLSSGLISGTATTLGLYQVTVTASDGEMSTVRSFQWAVITINTLEATNKETGASATSSRASETDYVDVSGDFDGDGRSDLATYRQSTSEWRIWTSSSNFSTPTVMVWGMEGDRPVAADYNGDRVTDFAVYRPSTGTWHLSLSGSQTPLAFQWGGPEDVPVPLDYDGDGKADLGLIRGGGYEILLSGANYLKSVRVY